MADKFDDAVVGAGVLGLAHAYHLAKRGRRVVVFERHRRAMGASVRNFGMLWPIGQPPGEMVVLARRSVEWWLEVLPQAGCWYERCGSLHLAYREDEAQVLREFMGFHAGDYGELQWWSATEVGNHCPRVRTGGLLGGMFSPNEVCIDPRQAIRNIADWLAHAHGVTFCWSTAVQRFTPPWLEAGGNRYNIARLWVCSGEDITTLYPGAFAKSGLRRCKLQMLRTSPMPEPAARGPMLAAGLTLRHYRAFETCPSLPRLSKRIASEMPEYDRFGIHVMASRNGKGEITIGDSHQYDLEPDEPFDLEIIDKLILDYLRSFLDIDDLEITQRWHGVYLKHPSEPFIVLDPEPAVTLINGVGGAGMTLSFGLAERVIGERLS